MSEVARQVSFCGLGNLGALICARLVASVHTVRAFDLRPEACKDFENLPRHTVAGNDHRQTQGQLRSKGSGAGGLITHDARR